MKIWAILKNFIQRFAGVNQLRDIYETVNHQKANRYVKQCIANQPLDEKIVKDIHALLMVY